MERRNKKGKTTKTYGILTRTSVMLPQVDLLGKITNNNTDNNADDDDKDKDEEMDEIDRLIARRAQNSQRFCKSLVDTYTPLTKKEKLHVFKDMNTNSVNRFTEYNNIFDEIKRQIADINNNLSESFIDNNHDKEKDKVLVSRKGKTRKTVGFRMTDPIQDKRDQTMNPHYSNTKVPKFTFDPLIDADTLDERIDKIFLRDCPIKDNSVLLMSTCSPRNNPCSEMTSPRGTEKSSFEEAKNEYKRMRDLFNQKKIKPFNAARNPKPDFNSKEFYCEPILAQQITSDRKAIDVKYCDCRIF